MKNNIKKEVEETEENMEEWGQGKWENIKDLTGRGRIAALDTYQAMRRMGRKYPAQSIGVAAVAGVLIGLSLAGLFGRRKRLSDHISSELWDFTDELSEAVKGKVEAALRSLKDITK